MALQSAMAIAAARSSGAPRRAMFVSLEGVELQPPERVANADHVVDDVVLHFRLVGEGMANAGPARVQSEDAAAPCLLHARGSHRPRNRSRAMETPGLTGVSHLTSGGLPL